MIQRIFVSALAAGFLAGLLVTGIQLVTTGPLILEAERYESGELNHNAETLKSKTVLAAFGSERRDAIKISETTEHGHSANAWLPGDGVERLSFTALANILTSMGFGFLLVAGFAVRGGEIDAGAGVVWGLGGFAAFSLAPSLGLPPETPGTIAAELAARQTWWAFTAAGTAAAIWLMVFTKQRVWQALGVLLLIAPHAFGAPQPGGTSDLVPPELASRFVSASLVTAAVFWAALGWLAGTFYRRFA